MTSQKLGENTLGVESKHLIKLSFIVSGNSHDFSIAKTACENKNKIMNTNNF